MGEVRVPDIPGPTAPLCWALGPTMVRCDRRAGHEGAHTWEPVPVAPAADDLDAALAWADDYADRLKCSVGQVTPSQRMCVTLAAAVRELRQNDVRGMNIVEAAVRSAPISDYINHWEGRCLKAESALAALKGRTCDKCKWQHPEFPNVCTNDNLHGNWLSCKDLGFTCGTWAAKEGV